jgi:hypothetical protein
MGLELCLVDFDSSRLCPVDSRSLWLVIIPKSKDRFMERPPMKIVPGIVCGRGLFGIPIGRASRVDSLWIRLDGKEWVKEWTLLRATRCKREPLVVWTDTSGETSAGALET